MGPGMLPLATKGAAILPGVALFECIPNLSEGRDLPGLEALAGRLEALGVAVLDLSSDLDHNRSVLTLAGDGPSLQRGAATLFDHALTHWSLKQHAGVHPRMGLVDVLPFVPLEGASMGQAAALAEAVGAAVSERHDLPVYLYEQAARDPRRRNLARVRRGGLTGITRRMGKAAWRPDFGPSRPHPKGGATAVGARFFLVAFNVLLQGARLPEAQAIAAQVRERGGGLPGVKALGLWLESRGMAQVSMNLVDFRQSHVHAAYRAVLDLARRQGHAVAGSEIVGLVPRAALRGGPLEELRLVDFREDQILEQRLAVHRLPSVLT